MQFDINRENPKILVLSWSKIDKNEYLIAEEITPLNQNRIQ